MRRFLITTIVLLAAAGDVASIASPGARPSPRGLLCTVAIDRSTVTVGSPVLVRMTLRNNGAKALGLTEPLDELYGTATVEMKRPGQKSFSPAPTAYTGLKQVEGFRSSLSKGETMVTYVLLLTGVRGGFLLDEAGRYELRARMRAGGQEAVSPPVAVEVRSPDRELQKKLESLRDDLTHVSLNEALDDRRLDRLRSRLANLPEFRNALLLAEAVTLIHRSNAAEQAEGAHKLQQLRDSRETFWRELATALLARHFARTGSADEARRLLAELPYRSTISDQANDVLESAPGDGKKSPDGRTPRS